MEMNQIIKERRKDLDLTLEQVGNVVGVGKSTVRKWENGDIENIRRDKIAALAEVLQVSINYLMGWEEEKKPTTPEGSELAMEFIKLFRQLSPDQQLLVVAQMKGILTNQPFHAEPPVVKP